MGLDQISVSKILDGSSVSKIDRAIPASQFHADLRAPVFPGGKMAVLLRTAALALSVGFGAPNSSAQETFIEPPLSRTDFGAIVSTLDMTDEQLTYARTLYEGFISEYQSRAKNFLELERAYREAFTRQETNVEELFQAYSVGHAELMVASIELRESLLEDLKSLLGKDEVDRLWPTVERLCHRQDMKYIPLAGMIKWSRLDLAEVVKSLGLENEETQKISQSLNNWALEIDVPLRHHWNLGLRMAHAGSAHFDQTEETAKDERLSISKRIAAINRRYSEIVCAQLDDSVAAKLREAIQTFVFPHIKFERPTEMLLERAEALKIPTKEGQAALRDLAAHYQEERKIERLAFFADCEHAEEEILQFRARKATDSQPSADPRGKLFADATARAQALEARYEQLLRPLLEK